MRRLLPALLILVGTMCPAQAGLNYDHAGRQTEITGTGNATTTRYDFVLSYDKYNNLGKQAETYANGMLASRNVTLSYDGADRLTREVLARSGGATITSNYTYDNAYNRTVKVTSNTSNSTIVANVTYHFNDGNQLDWFHDVTANTTANYTYDGAGNRLTLSFNGHDAGGNYNYTNTAVYYYDAANRLEEADLHTLVAASSNHTTQRYAEDFYLYGYDHRTRRTSMGQERLELSGNYIRLKEDWFDGGSPIRQSDANYTLSHTPMGNATTREFIRGSDWGGGVGGILYSLAGNATTAKYYHYDGRGDVVAQTGNTGAVTYQAEYDAYGKHDNVAAKGTQTSGTNNDPFQANTKEEDPTGFVNMGFRMYDLETGVFTTADPLGYGDGLNRYTFVHQNSMSRFDPEGLSDSGYYTAEIGFANKAFDNKMSVLADDPATKSMSGLDLAKKVKALVTERDERIKKAEEGLSNLDKIAANINEISGTHLTRDDVDDGDGGPFATRMVNLLDSGEEGARKDREDAQHMSANAQLGSWAKGVGENVVAGVVFDGTGKLLAKIGSETYQIIDGVRRAKAAQLAGKETVTVQIVDANMKVVATKEIPVKQLLSPKSGIDVSTSEKLDRFTSTLEKTRAGSTPPPLTVQPGSSGVPISSVKLDPTGGQ